MKNASALAAMIVFLAVVSVFAQDLSEGARIEYLIASVEALEGAKFIRNGREYEARTASNHLRLKLRGVGDRVKTAGDFITLCASKSSMSGEPYLIRLADGTTVKAEVFFRDKLKEIATDSPHQAR
jgi:hypothetical protein